jgi:hypothetical protein
VDTLDPPYLMNTSVPSFDFRKSTALHSLDQRLSLNSFLLRCTASFLIATADSPFLSLLPKTFRILELYQTAIAITSSSAMQILTVAIAALSIVAPVAAVGNALVYNLCAFDVSLWSVSADTKELTENVIKPGGNYSEAYQIPSVGGVSLKISDTDSVAGPITQFEYTLDGLIWYDISNVNCDGEQCPFEKYGMYLHGGKDCPTRSCLGGEVTCKGAYTISTDNWNTLSCDATDDISLYLCATSGPSSEKRSSQEQGALTHRRRRISHPHVHHHRSL